MVIPRRWLGRTGEQLSLIGFGGIIVMNATREESANHVAEAVDRGINYFDVAPSYGNAIERLGPALKSYRDHCFLACKTAERTAGGAEKELNASLAGMQTDHFDLYQLHAITTLDDVDKAFGSHGAMKTFLKARETGKIRFLGFSAHSEEAAHAAMDRFDFDTILFPFNFATWFKGQFGPSVHKRAMGKKMGLLALKAMAYQKWPEQGRSEGNPWSKCWYEPLDQRTRITLALRFTLNLPMCAAIPPGHWELFKMALEITESGAIEPLNDQEQDMLRQIAAASEPIFVHQA